MQILQQHRDAIHKLCRQHKVKRLDAFGSVLTNNFKCDSDLDLLVVFDEDYDGGAFAQYFDFKEALERLLQRPVDLVCYHAIKNRIFKQEVDSTKQPLYAA